MLPEHLNGFAAGGRLSNHLHVRLIVDDGCDALAEQGMIVNAEDADVRLFAHLFSSLDFCPLLSCHLASHRNKLLLLGSLWKAISAGTDN